MRLPRRSRGSRHGQSDLAHWAAPRSSTASSPAPPTPTSRASGRSVGESGARV